MSKKINTPKNSSLIKHSLISIMVGFYLLGIIAICNPEFVGSISVRLFDFFELTISKPEAFAPK